MRHLKRGRKLNRSASHRRALMRSLACALIAHERIITTVAKAKEMRPFVEKLITLAKKNTLHARRLALSRLGGKRSVPVNENDPKEAKMIEVTHKLFSEIGPRFSTRPGGYTRIIKRPQVRLGDAGRTAFIELLKEEESHIEKKAPAPQVADTAS